MVAPAIIAAGVSAAGSLLGGILGNRNNRKAIAAQNAYNHPSAIRARAEEAGFNPLLFVGPGVGNQAVAQQDMMGAAIANAGLAMSQGITEASAQKAYVDKLEAQNAELRKALDGATIRPKVAGIFGSVQPAKAAEVADAEAAAAGNVSVTDVSGDPAAVGAVGPFGLPTIVRGSMSDRPTEINAVQNEPWFKEVVIGGETVLVWNDEASDSELAATGLLLSVPLQIGVKRWKRASEVNAKRDAFDKWMFRNYVTFDPNHRDAYKRFGVFSGG